MKASYNPGPKVIMMYSWVSILLLKENIGRQDILLVAVYGFARPSSRVNKVNEILQVGSNITGDFVKSKDNYLPRGQLISVGLTILCCFCAVSNKLVTYLVWFHKPVPVLWESSEQTFSSTSIKCYTLVQVV